MYAPLYGNRLIHNSNLKALEKKVGKTVDAHVAEICEIKDEIQTIFLSSMIERNESESLSEEQRCA